MHLPDLPRVQPRFPAPAPAPVPVPAAGPAPKEQYNFTDPDSRIMPSSQGFVQAYNAQAAVDSYGQIIVACDVCQETTDSAQLRPLFAQVRQTTGGWPDQASAESGDWSAPNVQALAAQGIDVYLPPPRPRRGAAGARPAAQTSAAKAQMQVKLATPTGQRRYSRRKETAEPVFGQMKEARGLRRFRTRGLVKVRGEWALWCATHTLGTLANVLRRRGRPLRQPAPSPLPAVCPQAPRSRLWRLSQALGVPRPWDLGLTTLTQTGS